MTNLFNLQLFAEGGEGGAAVTTTGTTADTAGSNQNPPTGTEGKTADNAETGTAAQVQSDPKEDFKSLIKGKYKNEFNESVKQIVDKRFKASQAQEESLKKLMPALETLSEHYGLDASKVDFEALANKIMTDNSLFEAEALEKGMDVNEFRRIKSLEKENARLLREQGEARAEAERQREFNEIVKQVPDVQQVYPSFDLGTELNNPDFFRLLQAHVPVKTAYEVVHQNEIQPAVMQVVAQKTQEQLANSIQANSKRPNETTIGAGTTDIGVDISKLTKKEFKEYQKRAANGERITFR